eukprot:6041067-Amphidinium_carterae.1
MSTWLGKQLTPACEYCSVLCQALSWLRPSLAIRQCLVACSRHVTVEVILPLRCDCPSFAHCDSHKL